MFLFRPGGTGKWCEKMYEGPVCENGAFLVTQLSIRY
jgi:hypothetical protein